MLTTAVARGRDLSPSRPRCWRQVWVESDARFLAALIEDGVDGVDAVLVDGAAGALLEDGAVLNAAEVRWSVELRHLVTDPYFSLDADQDR
jgi:hypothetical protein